MSTETRYSRIIDSASSSRLQKGSAKDSSQATLSLIPLDKILDRAIDTRAYNDQEIHSLAMSMKQAGLIEPLVLDENNRLLCGGRRRAAIQMLKETSEEDYKQHFPDDRIPCRVYQVDALQEPEKALEIEVMENTHRKNYKSDEVRRAAQRLLDAGYVNTVGRAPKGAKRLKPTLAELFGMSVKQITRILSGEDQSEQESKQKTEETSPKQRMQSTYQIIHRKRNWSEIEKSPVLKKKYAQAQKLLDEIAVSLNA